MRVADMNWMQVEAVLEHEDRAVLPLGSTEQHAYLSLATDSILAERVATAAAEPLGVPVFPVVSYGITPNFTAYPGTVTLRSATFLSLVREILEGISEAGFRRILIVNGHGGNAPAQALAAEWAAEHPGARIQFHNWWNAPRTIAKVREIDPNASHASWMESFPWTRVEGVTVPREPKPMVDLTRLSSLDPRETRSLLGDGSFGGLHRRPDEEILAVWEVAIQETRELLAGGWS